MARNDAASPRSFIAGEDLNQYDAVKVGAADNTVIKATAAADRIIGSADQTTKSGDPVPVVQSGKVTFRAHAAITRGQAVVGAAAGRVATTAAAVANTRIVAVEAAAAQDDLFRAEM